MAPYSTRHQSARDTTRVQEYAQRRPQGSAQRRAQANGQHPEQGWAQQPARGWAQRLADPGWLLLPLRGFLGATFIYAGLQKLANPEFFSATSPTSVASQMHSFQHTSPIGGLLDIAGHFPTVTGLVIALGELAVGIGALLGVSTRIAAAGGMALSLSFFLTVSWTTTPYYYGADIVFAFAWLTLFAFGDCGVLSLGRFFAARDHALSPTRQRPAARTGVDRRAAVRFAGLAAGVAGLAAVTASIGRLVGGTRRNAALAADAAPTAADAPAAAATASPTSPPASPTGRTGASTAPAHVAGTAIGPAAAVPVGQAQPFADPATGDPAWLVHASANQFVAFDAVCTHAGCTVDYDPTSVQFQCPCHGGRFDARTGGVLQGPPQQPLRPIPVRVAGGQVRVDA